MLLPPQQGSKGSQVTFTALQAVGPSLCGPLSTGAHLALLLSVTAPRLGGNLMPFIYIVPKHRANGEKGALIIQTDSPCPALALSLLITAFGLRAAVWEAGSAPCLQHSE